MSIPPDIGKLTNLEYLDIRSNKLKYIPLEIYKLINLLNLFLQYNKIKFLPFCKNYPKFLTLYNTQFIVTPNNICMVINHRLILNNDV